MASLPDRGRLDETSLPRLLIDVYRAGFDGTLRLTRGRTEKAFRFQGGVPVFAESNLASESLGVQLMDTGRLSRADYNRVVKHVEAGGGKEGQALLELSLLEPRELFVALKEQVRVRVIECFGWAHGDFLLEPSEAPPEAAQPFRAEVYALIQEGIETHWSPDRILTDLGPKMGAYPARTSRLSRIQTRLRWDDSVERYLDALGGRLTLWKALQSAMTPRALAAAWVLDAAQAIEYRDQLEPDGSEDAPERPVEIVFEDATQRRAPRAARSASRAATADTAAMRALREEVGDKHERLEELDLYELLGVKADAGADDLKRAYLRAAKTYHPDALARAGLDPETLEMANRVFAEIGRAYAVLSDANRRREYDTGMHSDHGTIDADQIATAEGLYRKGEILLRQGNFRGALEFLKPAVELWPEEAAYQAGLGWALYKKMPSEPEEAKVHLEKAAQLEPEDGVVLFRLSVVLRSLGETVAAATLLDKAKRIDPSVV